MTPKQKNTFFVLILLAAVLFYTFSGGSVGISLDFGDERLSLGASDRDWVIPYDQIASLELTALTDLGTPVDGTKKRTLSYGTWENDLWDKYTLCVNPTISQCIVVTLQDGSITVLNYENEESTKALHTMFSELLQSKGYLQ